MAAPAIGTPALLFSAVTIISFYRVSGRISLPASDFLPCHVVPGRRAGPVPAAVLGSSGAGKGMPVDLAWRPVGRVAVVAVNVLIKIALLDDVGVIDRRCRQVVPFLSRWTLSGVIREMASTGIKEFVSPIPRNPPEARTRNRTLFSCGSMRRSSTFPRSFPSWSFTSRPRMSSSASWPHSVPVPAPQCPSLFRLRA